MNPRPKFVYHTFFVLSLVSPLMGCGGGGSGDSGGGSPAPTTVASKGTVTAMGSVFVNGIEFATTAANIKIDDNPGIESDLKVGMVVTVKGTSDDVTKTGTANEVEARDSLEGTISAVVPATNTLTVMGQDVRIEDNVTRLNDDNTQKVFADAAFVVGDIVEVSGFPDDNGGLRATRVARKGIGEFEVKGFVSVLDANSFALSLTPLGPVFLTVNYVAILPPGTANGSFVEVKSIAAPVAGAITANFIKLEDALGASGAEVEVEGIVSSGTVASFVVNSQAVTTTAATLYEGGLKTDFDLGVKLEAEGTLDNNGVLVASKVSFRSSIRIEADASAVSASGLTVLGKAVAINPFTRIDNGPIANDDHVEVRAFPDRDGNLIASRVVVQGADSKAFLQAPVTAFSAAAGTMTFLGTAIASDNNTEWRISTDGTDLPVTAATFFANLKLNVSVVKVRWDNFTATTNPIKQAEIQLGK